MKLTHSGKRWEVRFSLSDIHHPLFSRLFIDRTGRVAWTKDIAVAVALRKYAEGMDRDRLEAEANRMNASYVKSHVKSSEFAVPIPNNGRHIYPYQKAGVEFALERDGTLIGDEPGLGKSLQAIGVANLSDWKRMLIISPASLKLNWMNEIALWSTKSCPVHLLSGVKPKDIGNGLFIINYDILYAWQHVLQKIQWDIIVADEIHYIANMQSRRTQAFLNLQAPRRIGLTGTPIRNRPEELYPMLSWLDKEHWPSKLVFEREFCDRKHTRYGLDTKGASNLKELNNRLRGTVMIRRLAKDVLPDLPPITRQVIELPADGCGREIREEWKAYHEYECIKRRLEDVIDRARISKDESEFMEEIDKLRHGERVAWGAMSKVRIIVARKKIPMMLEILSGYDEPVIFFCWHLEVADEIRKANHGCSFITGGVASEKRQEQVDRFQRGDTNLIAGTIPAMGVGYNMTRARIVVFGEGSWVPSDLSQCEHRACRIGQKKNVLAQHLVLEGSLDATQAKRCVEKQRTINEALD